MADPVPAESSRHKPDKLPEEQEAVMWRHVLSNFPTALVVYRFKDREIARMWVGKGVAEICGYRVDEIESQPPIWLDIAHPQDRDRLRAMLERVTSGEAACEEYRVFRKDGQMRTVRELCAPHESKGGRVDRAVGFLTDITGRKQVEEALRESEERYRALVENIDAVIFRLTPDTRPIMVLGRPEGIAGYSLEELANPSEPWKDDIHPEDRALVDAAEAEIIRGGSPGPMEFRVVDRRGNTYWIRTHVTPKFDDNHHLLYLDGIALDITERVETAEREARRVARMAALAEISQVFASSLDFNEIIDICIRRMGEVLDCTCYVASGENQTGELAGLCRSIDTQAHEDGCRLLDTLQPSIAAAFERGDMSPRVISGASTSSPAALENQEGVGPAILAPLNAGDETLCTLAALRRIDQPDFREEDIWFVTEVASHASGALTCAALYRRQTRIAETLQRSLIPVSPTVQGMEIATCYFPALGETEVGGDFFDVIDFPDGLVGVVVGDVSGKGMEAAVYTAEAKYMLRGFAHQNPDPGTVITALNEALWTYTTEDTFVTLIYALIDPARRGMLYVNAGHEPPLVLRCGEHAVRGLMPHGPVLAVLKDQQFTSVRAELTENDLFFCYTDGVTDLPSDGERFGYDRLLQTISNSSAASAQELLDHVVATVNAFGGTHRHDDQVMVVVRPSD